MYFIRDGQFKKIIAQNINVCYRITLICDIYKVLTSVTTEVPTSVIALEPGHGKHVGCWHRGTLSIDFKYI